MRVLGLSSYPIEAAATRYRLAQFVEPLSKKGIEIEISSFLTSEEFALLYRNAPFSKKLTYVLRAFFNRLTKITKFRKYDVIFVQREAMFFGPAFFEYFFQVIGGLPLVLDLDDATYVSYVSPTYGKIGSFFKFFGKTDRLIERADAVTCGNHFIAEYVSEKGKKPVVIPTVVDTNKFFPLTKDNKIPVMGWIGTHSTFPLLQSIFPVLQKLAQNHDFVLKIVGSGVSDVKLEGVKIENLEWNIQKEVADFQSLDIGLYPIVASDPNISKWILGKSGFKAIQYLAVGVPYVVTPIGVCAEIGEANISHFTANTADDWYNALDKLLSDKTLRENMGEAGRGFALRDFTVEKQCAKLEDTLKFVYENHKR